jgi:hypothetical protein
VLFRAVTGVPAHLAGSIERDHLHPNELREVLPYPGFLKVIDFVEDTLPDGKSDA